MRNARGQSKAAELFCYADNARSVQVTAWYVSYACISVDRRNFTAATIVR